MKRLAVLLSDAGTGTNLQAMIDAIEAKRLKAKIVIVVSDTKKAKGLDRARKHGLEGHVLVKGEDLVKILKGEYQVNYVCLTGWKKIIPDQMIEAFNKRILNIHPGLIPDKLDGQVKNPDGTIGLWNRGKLTETAIRNFFDKQCTYAGSSVHFLSQEFDFGLVLGRCFEKIKLKDTVESLYDRLKKKEHQIYVKSLIKLCN